MRGGPPGGIGAPVERASNQNAVLRRLGAYMRPYYGSLGVILALVILTSAAQAAAPALIGRAIDVFIIANNQAGLNQTMWILLAVYVGGFVAQTAQINLLGVVGQRFLASLRAQIFDTVQMLPLAFFDRTKAGDLMSRLVNDIQTLNMLVSQGLSQLIGSVFSLVGILIAMVIISPPLALVSFLILPLIFFTTKVFARRSRRAFQRTRVTIGDVSATLQEDIAGVRVAQAFNRTGSNIRQFAAQNAANRDANVQATAVTSAFMPAIDLLSTLATAMVAAVGGWLAVRNQIEVGTVVAFFLYVQQFFRPIQMISNIYNQLQNALAGAERIFELVDTPITQKQNPEAIEMPPIKGEVTFQDVSFAYSERPGDAPDRGAPLVLRDVSFKAEPGQTVALVGPTGAGKTTIVNLIPRFYDPTGGAVLIDGYDTRDVMLASLRRQLGLVLQDSFLFSGTIADNIRYGRLDATDEEVEAAAKAVHAHDFIMTQSKGYDTPLGERGGNLSQGQRQLLSLARAVLADPRILILDEATSNIDTSTEALIQDALKTLLQGRTAFVIAHRLSTIRQADQVLVVDGGQIVERGNHTTLLEHGGLYAELYRRQFRDQPADVAAE